MDFKLIPFRDLSLRSTSA